MLLPIPGSWAALGYSVFMERESACVCVPAVVQADWTRNWQPGPMVHIQTKVQLTARSLCPLKYFPAPLCAKKMSENMEKGKQRRHWLLKPNSDILNVLSDIVHYSQMLEIEVQRIKSLLFALGIFCFVAHLISVVSFNGSFGFWTENQKLSKS